MTNARENFARALHDELAPSERAEFEAAISADSELAAEFEAFADEQAGGGLENIGAWLERSGGARVHDAAGIHAQMADELIAKAQRRRRGKLIQLFGAITAVAAAAALVAVLILPSKTIEPQAWPDNAPGQTQVMYGGSIYYQAQVEEFHPAEGVTLHIEANSLIQPRDRGALLQRGTVKVKLDKAARYDIHVGDRSISAQGPAEFEVTTEPQQYTELSPIHSENDPMFQSRLLSRFGASGFALTFSVISGAATLHGAGAPQVHNAPFTQTIQAGPPQQGQPPKPPTAQDVFDHLDANSDAVLDRPEVELGIAGLAVRAFRAYDAAYRLRSFDANGDGLLSPTELSGIDLEWRVPGGTQQQAGERGITPFQLQEKLLQLSEDRLTDIQYWLARNNPEALP